MAGNTLASTASTAAARYQPAAENVPADVQKWQMIQEQATFLSKAGDLVPKAYRDNPGAIMAAGLAGQPFGWNVITSMRMGHVINGGWQLNAESQAALIRQAGHRLEIKRSTDRAVVTGTRRDDGTSYTATWDQARAEGVPSVEWVGPQGNRGKIETNLWEKWKKGGTTEYMLAWRAISEVARFLFAELMYGMAYAEGERPEFEAPEPGPAELDVTPELLPSAPAGVVMPRSDGAGPLTGGGYLEPGVKISSDLLATVVEPTIAEFVEPEVVNLFGEPGEAPAAPGWKDWGRPEWTNHVAGKLSLNDIRTTWGFRNFDAVVAAEDPVKAAIYDAARGDS